MFGRLDVRRHTVGGQSRCLFGSGVFLHFTLHRHGASLAFVGGQADKTANAAGAASGEEARKRNIEVYVMAQSSTAIVGVSLFGWALGGNPSRSFWMVREMIKCWR